MNSLHRSLFLALAFSPVALLAQGSLTPPGAPAPAMKTLTQVEPRFVVNTLPGDATALHVIDVPGSYYLTANLLGAAGKSTLRITASNVTVDLNGFMIQGEAGSLDGIEVGYVGSVALRNGGIRAHRYGVGAGSAYQCDLSHLSVLETLRSGICLGSDSTVSDCSVQAACGAGIEAESDLVVTRCVVTTVTPLPNGDPLATKVCGIRATVVSDSSVFGINGASYVANAHGIVARTVENSTVYNVTGYSATNATSIEADVIRGCSANFTIGGSGSNTGIRGKTVVDCQIRSIGGNGNAGIRNLSDGGNFARNSLESCGLVVTHGTTVTDNNISLSPGSGTGISVTGAGNRIDGNHVALGNQGIVVSAANNFVVRNFVYGSSTKYSLAAGSQAVVAIVTADDITTASPWANFAQ